METWTKESALAHIAANIIVLENGCHEWQGSKTKDGYGQLSRDTLAKTFGIKGVHRLVVHLVHGHEFKSRGEQTMHSCHYRACCNPDHLSVGTAKENAAQITERKGYWNSGENHARAIFTNDTVRYIKQLMAYGWTNQWIMQHVPNLSPTNCSNIRTGRRWSKITI